MKLKSIIFIVIILIAPNVDFARQEKGIDDAKKEFNKVADIFEKNVKPYLQKFASDQFNLDMNTPEAKRLVDTYYKLYFQKVEQIRINGLKAFLEKENEQNTKVVDKTNVIGHFDLAYRANFPGLDYKFYALCEKDLK